MPTRIDSLTDQQSAQIPGWAKKWTEVGLCTDPANFEAAKTAALECYRITGYDQPKVVLYMNNPFAATIGGVIATHLLEKGMKPNVVKQKVENNLSAIIADLKKEPGWQKIKESINSQWTSYRGCQVWAGWYAYVSFLRDVCNWENEHLEAYAYDEQVALNCGWSWWHENVLSLSDRPREIHRDQAGRLHYDEGPAVLYGATKGLKPSGALEEIGDMWGIYSWHGYRIPRSHIWIIAEKHKINADAIEKEPNAELRRIMLEIHGYENYVNERNFKVISEDVDGNGFPRQLLETKVSGEVVRMLRVINGSQEPDGTYRKFVLGAMPGANTPHDAVARSYGINPKVYVDDRT